MDVHTHVQDLALVHVQVGALDVQVAVLVDALDVRVAVLVTVQHHPINKQTVKSF